MTVHPEDLGRVRALIDDAEKLVTELRARLATLEAAKVEPMEEPTWLGAVVLDQLETTWTRMHERRDVECPWGNQAGYFRSWGEIIDPRPETAAERAERGAPPLLQDKEATALDALRDWYTNTTSERVSEVIVALRNAATDLFGVPE